MLLELFLEFLLFAGGVYLGVGLLMTLVFVLVDYYLRMPANQRSLREFIREVAGWRSEWKEVALVVIFWPTVWGSIIADRRHAREDAARLRELDARREERRLKEQARWREEASVRRKAVVQAAKPPRKVRKAVLRRQRGRRRPW